jgi:hypothetical protein
VSILGIIASSKLGAPAGAFESIASATGTGSSGSITFSSIPSTYVALQLRILTKDTSTNNGNSSSPYLRLNGDTGSNYTSHYILADGTTIYVVGEDAATNAGTGILLNLQPGSGSSVTNTHGVAIIDLHDYASTTKNKTVRVFSGTDINAATSFTNFVNLTSGAYLSTSAVNSITIYNNGSRLFTTTSVFSLYGIKGA